MIAIIVAMEKELRLLLPLLEGRDTIAATDGSEIHTGTIEGRPVAVAQCGIGKVNAALRTAAIVDTVSPSIVINSGVAGGTGSEARILDVVVGDRVAYHDVWCGPGTVWGQAAGCPLYFESAPEAVNLTCLKGPGIHHGLVCSGDIFVSDPEVTRTIRSRFPEVLAVDMESAAVAQTCYKRGVPFLCLRVLSDTPGDNDNNIAQYENFWDDAPARTFGILRAVVASLPA